MEILPVVQQPSSQIVNALAEFEKKFTYPLGPNRKFSISHGTDYARFFRAIGQACCFVALRSNRVLGVLAVSLRPLLLPNGEEKLVGYFGDLKIDPEVRGGRTILYLANAAKEWINDRVDMSFAVVMDGTTAIPTNYSGRIGIPLFQKLGSISILRITTNQTAAANAQEFIATQKNVNHCYRALSIDRFASLGGQPSERSRWEPLYLLSPDGNACGILEDTLHAKRLIADDGTEMKSAHLSCFACKDIKSGKKFLEVALSLTKKRELPCLFVSVATADIMGFQDGLKDYNYILATATVYGTGLPPHTLWNINTAEI